VTRVALLIALTAAATMAVRIPVPRTGGYINMGDGVIYITALLFGRTYGAAVGGIGSALADFLGGYALFAPFTLVIKGLEGFLVGVLGAWRGRGGGGRAYLGAAVPAVAIVVGGAEMVAGYFVAEAYLLHLGVGAAASEVPGNVAQVLGGLVLALIVAPALRRVAAMRGEP
jgi:uncharacterized membrane protein